MASKKPTTVLDVAEGLTFPVDAVTETFGILGIRGSGKTTTARRMVEQITMAGQQSVVIDPLGVWWGLRSSADGEREGLPFIVLGGEHGDVPISEDSGELIADLVIDDHLPAVVDLSEMRKGAQRRFMTAFVDRLYHRNRKPLTLVVDECDLFIHQRPPKGTEQLVGAMEDIVRRGRARGLGIVLISQRPAVIHKDVLSQVSVLVAHRLTGPQDRKALDTWVEAHGSTEKRDEMAASLASLKTGEAWFWSPAWLDVFTKTQVHRPDTFDSSATPKVGEDRIVPQSFATVDLDSLRDRLAETIEKAEADDPSALRRRIKSLETELARAKKNNTKAEPEIIEQVIEVEKTIEVVPDAVQDALSAAARLLEDIGSDLGTVRDRMVDAHRQVLVSLRDLPEPRTVTAPPPAKQQKPKRRAQPATKTSPTRTSSTKASTDSDAPKLKAGARRILDTLARHHPTKLTRSQIGTLSRFKISGGTFQTYWSTLKRAGYVEERDDLSWITDEGLAEAGVEPADPQTTEELLDMWRGSLKAGARKMLDVLIDNYPNEISRQDLADEVEMTETGGTFQTYLSTLRRNGLADVNADTARASDTLFLAE